MNDYANRDLIRWCIVGLAVAAGLGGGVAGARADGFIVVPDSYREVRLGVVWPRPRPAYMPLQVKYHRVDAEVTDNPAVTRIDQAFYNPSPRQLEGTYIFPFPDDVTVQRFSMFMNGKEVQGEVLERDQARKIYEEIVSKSKDPALLEYMGTRMYRARVFPIPANGEVQIKLDYSQAIEVVGGLGTYRYPLNTEKFSSAPLGEVAVRVRIKSQVPLATIFCPSHQASIDKRDPHEATVGYEARNVLPDKDFVVGYQMSDQDFGLALLLYRERGEEGYFMARVVPPSTKGAHGTIAKDIAFVVDTSGSMSGAKIEQVRQALRFCLDNLNADDRFNVIAFATEVNPYRETLIPATKDNLAAARDYAAKLEAKGGTNINDALATALKSGGPSDKTAGRPYMIVFLTDGLPTIGETHIDTILANVRKANSGNVRLFVFGVGDDVNTQLLDKMAEDNHGARQYVAPQEDLELKLSNFYTMIAYPVLSDVRLEFGGAEVFDAYPKVLPDLFKGSELVVFGRYKNAGRQTITLQGQRRDTTERITWQKSFADRELGHDYLPRLWAARKVGYLLDHIRLNGENEELKGEVVRLAKKYGILTPYTSFLVIEEDELNRRAGRVVASPAPARLLQSQLGDGATIGRRSFISRSGGEAVNTSKGLNDLKHANDFDSYSSQLFGVAGAGGAFAHQSWVATTQPADLEGRPPEANPVRFVASRTFYLDGEKWVDSQYDASKPTTKVKLFNEEYFHLLVQHPEAGKFCALGPRVIMLIDGKVYETVAD